MPLIYPIAPTEPTLIHRLEARPFGEERLDRPMEAVRRGAHPLAPNQKHRARRIRARSLMNTFALPEPMIAFASNPVHRRGGCL